MKSDLSIRIGAVLWFLCFQFFVAEQIARFAWTTPYSFVRNVISDLGAAGCTMHPIQSIHYVCSPLHDLMNASFILQGVLIAGGAALLPGAFPPGKRRSAALGLIFVAGVTLIGVGLAPEDTRPGIHVIMAAIHFLCGNGGMIVLGRTLLQREATDARNSAIAGRISMLAGCIGYAGLVLLISRPLFGGDIRGGLERIVAYPFPLWLTGMGIYCGIRSALSNRPA